MPVELDPEDREIQTLLEIAGDFGGRRVLEVGCGDGRLTWRYAGLAAQVVGIDPDAESIIKASKETPAELRGRVQFESCELNQFEWPEPFDMAIMSWSL
jgi:predicted RNA methylase